MSFRRSCQSAWSKLRLSPMFGCICPTSKKGSKASAHCDTIFATVNGNPCIGRKFQSQLNPMLTSNKYPISLYCAIIWTRATHKNVTSICIWKWASYHFLPDFLCDTYLSPNKIRKSRPFLRNSPALLLFPFAECCKKWNLGSNYLKKHVHWRWRLTGRVK